MKTILIHIANDSRSNYYDTMREILEIRSLISELQNEQLSVTARGCAFHKINNLTKKLTE